MGFNSSRRSGTRLSAHDVREFGHVNIGAYTDDNQFDAEETNIKFFQNYTKSTIPLESQLARSMNEGGEAAIIGYWDRQDGTPSSKFVCYHYFYVPSPLKREIRKS